MVELFPKPIMSDFDYYSACIAELQAVLQKPDLEDHSRRTIENFIEQNQALLIRCDANGNLV